MIDRNEEETVFHTNDGTYRIDTLLTPEMRDMTLEQVMTLLVYKIVKHPEDVEVVFASMPRRRVLDFDMHPSDRGCIIGKSGYIIQALRTIAKAILGPDCKLYRYSIEVAPDAFSQNTPQNVTTA